MYYSKGSYLSANWFTKHVTNFLTSVTTKEPLFGITDPNAGALANKAIAELTAGRQGCVGPEHIRADSNDHRITGPFLGQAGDPWSFGTSRHRPTATKPTSTDLNCRSSICSGTPALACRPIGRYRRVVRPGTPWQFGNQFALAGLSRSYNFVGFFERWGFQTRVAYTHRGAFLASLNQPRSIE